MEYTIETANNAKKQAIVALLAANKLPVEDLPDSLDSFFVASDNGTIIGVGGMELYGDYALLRSVAVDNAYRNQHVAAGLLFAIEETAAHNGLKAIYLLTETAPQYFEKKGYALVTREEVPGAVKQSSEFSHVCPVSAAVMVKKLRE